MTHVGRFHVDFGDIFTGQWWAALFFTAQLVAVLLVGGLISLTTTPSDQWGSSVGFGIYALFLALVVGGAGAAFVAMVCAPLSWLIARALRPVPSAWLHRMAFAAYGAVVASLIAWLLTGAAGFPAWGYVLPLAAMGAIACALGWERAYRRRNPAR